MIQGYKVVNVSVGGEEHLKYRLKTVSENLKDFDWCIQMKIHKKWREKPYLAFSPNYNEQR